MKKYILALDEGTTSARAILFDRQANIISMAQHFCDVRICKFGISNTRAELEEFKCQ